MRKIADRVNIISPIIVMDRQLTIDSPIIVMDRQLTIDSKLPL
jgi:hypothetical protein